MQEQQLSAIYPEIAAAKTALLTLKCPKCNSFYWQTAPKEKPNAN